MSDKRILFPLASQRIKSTTSWLELLTAAWMAASRRHRRKQDLSGSSRIDETQQKPYSWGMKAPTESAEERGEEPAFMAQTAGSEAPLRVGAPLVAGMI